MPARNTWTAETIPDQGGRIALVTGANSGIGYETARALAHAGATVILAVRSVQKGQSAAARIRDEQPRGSVEVRTVDLADLATVRRLADRFHREHDQLHLLINNAGVMMPPRRQRTSDGFELQFGTNHLGHFALTGLLLDGILRAGGSRVVVLTSLFHRFGAMRFHDLHCTRSYLSVRAYGQSKLANLLFAYELQRRLGASGFGTLAVAAHPGWSATNLQRYLGPVQLLNPLFGQTPRQGASATLYAATADDVVGGALYGPGGFLEMRGAPRRARSNKSSHDADLAAQLWRVSEQLTGVRFTTLER